MNVITEYHAEYFTATILEWKKLLKPEKYKDIIVNSLAFLVKEKRLAVYAFVIMDNHIHILWQPLNDYTPEKIQLSFMRYTAQQIKFDLQKYHPEVLEKFYVNASDRQYQFWERNPLSVALYTQEAFLQKLDYIHNNPVKADLCLNPEDYKYSSARFYERGINDWEWVTHYVD